MIAERAHTMYPQSITGSYIKEDGSPRICYNPAPPVKQLHQKMIEAIFNHVTFPFLHQRRH